MGRIEPDFSENLIEAGACGGTLRNFYNLISVFFEDYKALIRFTFNPPFF